MAWGISPYKTITIPLGDYNADHYLTLLYTSFNNLGWHIGYFDHDGIIAYTNISWPSYSEEVSARVQGGKIIIKSECVGYQALFTDYGKNKKNLDMLFYDMGFTEVQLETTLEQTTQQLMDAVPEKQFLSLTDPPMAGKERLHNFLSAFTPQQNYFITPILALINIAVYIITSVAMIVILMKLLTTGQHGHIGRLIDIYEKVYMSMGFNGRSQVLSGQVWRLLTSTFLHFSLMHLAGNMIVLIYIGSLIESKLGKWNFLFLYLFTGLMASMVSIMWHDQIIGGGASGAIFGLFGILLALLSTNFYERSARRALLISTGIFVAYNIIPRDNHIDHAAHFGGLISGYVLGLVAYWGLSNNNASLKKWGIVLAGAGITVLFIGCSVFLTPNYNLKKYEELNIRSRELNRSINNDFYNGDSVSRNDRLNILEHKAMPKLSRLRKIAATYEQMPLPGKKKKIAVIRAGIIRLECDFYILLYKEFKENDKVKYRKAINDDTDKINNLRLEWGKIDDGE